MPKQVYIDQSYPMLLETENRIKLLEPFKGTKIHHQMQCLVCNHVWSATPLSKRQTLKNNGVSGCPACNDKRIEDKRLASHVKHIKDLAERGVVIIGDYFSLRTTQKLVKFKNINCGHEFETLPGNLINLNGSCTVCGKVNRVSEATKWSKSNSANWQLTATDWQKYKTQVTQLTIKQYRLHKNKINPGNKFSRGVAGKEGAYHLDHIVPKRFCFDHNIPAELCADYRNLQMIGWKQNVGSRNHIKGTVPPMFFQYITAGTKLNYYADVLQTIFPTSERFVNVADIIATVYDSALNHAVVVIPIDKSHANLKSALSVQKQLSQAEINYTILFEDELNDVQLLKSKLLHYTKSNQADKIHARQCVIKLCEPGEKKELLNANHVQGTDNAPIAYGAYYKDQLVAVMTFSAPRVALGQKGQKDRSGMWELSRFCTDVHYRIPGIASKLLTHFKRNHSWKEIYSYADKRWSSGNMYIQLGFDKVGDNAPDYCYVIDGVRKHRWNYRKDILKNTLLSYDPSLTEYQNMQANGMWRIWDCGTLKFQITNPAHDK